jgi:DNA gyrase subunit B
MGYTSRDIDVIEGLEAIRRRPSMYVGDATGGRTLCSRFLECVVGNVAAESPPPTAVRLIVWMGNALTVAYDGEPLPIRPVVGPGAISHPELYTMFMTLLAPGSPLALWAAIANALSERLVVSTMHENTRYRAAFRRGGLVSLLSKTPTDESLGTSWLTLKPDADVVPGAIDATEAEAIVRRLKDATPAVHLTTVDRTNEKPDWW